MCHASVGQIPTPRLSWIEAELPPWAPITDAVELDAAAGAVPATGVRREFISLGAAAEGLSELAKSRTFCYTGLAG